MDDSVLSTLRYVRGWMGSPRPGAAPEERLLVRGDRTVGGTLLPPPSILRAPGWVVLHGMSRLGRGHPSLVRFAHALRDSGAAVLLPEVPEWTRLAFAPGVLAPTLRAAAEALEEDPRVLPGRVGVIGFSFGATQATLAVADRSLGDRFRTVVGFGGYGSLESTFTFALTGAFEHEGESLRLPPDPYAGWVVAANYLERVPGLQEAGDVARAVRRLAERSSEGCMDAMDPRLEEAKAELRERVAPGRRWLFDLLSPRRGDAPGDPEREARALELARALAATVRSVEPALDPSRVPSPPRIPVHLLHGRADRLIPFPESYRLAELLAPARVRVDVTGLFAHSEGSRGGRMGARLREGWRFGQALRGILAAV